MTNENSTQTPPPGQPLVSVIVPCYNVERFLDRCIDSLLAQTQSGLEFVFVNDCSTDGTAAIIRRRLPEFSCAQFIDCPKNGGVSVARNIGVAAAHGRYIGSVDSDDVALPTLFETLVRALESSQADVAQIAYVITTDASTKPAQPAQEEIRLLTGLEALADMFQQEHYALWDRLYKRELFDDGTGNTDLFPVGLTCEDRVGNMHLLARARTVAISNRVEYLYMDNLGSISSDGLNRRGFDLLLADEINVRVARAMGNAQVLKLAEDRAAKGAFSLLVKWMRFGITDPQLDEEAALKQLWERFHADYPRLMASDLSSAKRLVAWQMEHCPSVAQAAFRGFRGVEILRRQQGAKDILKQPRFAAKDGKAPRA